jgi:hypothetical protein
VQLHSRSLFELIQGGTIKVLRRRALLTILTKQAAGELRRQGWEATPRNPVANDALPNGFALRIRELFITN